MNINGKMKVFVKQFDDGVAYSTSIGKKNTDGKYTNDFRWVKFLGTDGKVTNPRLDNMTDVNVIDGFDSFNDGKDGHKPGYVVKKWEVLNAPNGAPEGFQQLDDDRMPWE